MTQVVASSDRDVIIFDRLASEDSSVVDFQTISPVYEGATFQAMWCMNENA